VVFVDLVASFDSLRTIPRTPGDLLMKGWKVGVILSLFGSGLLAAAPIQALPESQIATKLQGIPVFALTDADNLLLTASVASEPGKPAKGGVFFSQADAKTFLQKLQKENPSVAKQLEVRPVSLSEVYKAQVDLDPKKRVDILYVPSQNQVKTALTLMQKTEPSLKQFTGVPLFVAKVSKKGTYLTTIDKNSKATVPLFFDRDQLQPLIDKFKKQQPNAAVEVQVLTLETLLDSMRSENNPLYESLVFGPSREGLEVLRNRTATNSIRGGAN
jgi:Tic22-like family